jgi:hypothetical protein
MWPFPYPQNQNYSFQTFGQWTGWTIQPHFVNINSDGKLISRPSIILFGVIPVCLFTDDIMAQASWGRYSSQSHCDSATKHESPNDKISCWITYGKSPSWFSRSLTGNTTREHQHFGNGGPVYKMVWNSPSSVGRRSVRSSSGFVDMEKVTYRFK